MIYAFSDAHGDYKQLVKLLQIHGVLDEERKWIAKDSTLICAGDSTDRGNYGIKVLQLMQRLSQEAELQDGRVIHLCGNHDALFLCLALEHRNLNVDYEHDYLFKVNGGKTHEAISLSRLHSLRNYVQSFPLMCRVDDILFQHADGFNFYNKITKDGETPEEKIQIANKYAKDKLSTSWGAWSLFSDITDERKWNNNLDEMESYLDDFKAKAVVHGHTGYAGTLPLIYLDNQAVNIDAKMSNGYRKDEERGCVLIIDSPGKDIVV